MPASRPARCAFSRARQPTTAPHRAARLLRHLRFDPLLRGRALAGRGPSPHRRLRRSFLARADRPGLPRGATAVATSGLRREFPDFPPASPHRCEVFFRQQVPPCHLRPKAARSENRGGCPEAVRAAPIVAGAAARPSSATANVRRAVRRLATTLCSVKAARWYRVGSPIPGACQAARAARACIGAASTSGRRPAATGWCRWRRRRQRASPAD